MVLGLTGKYCSGKNAVAQILERHGFVVVDVDQIGHRALAERRDAVVQRFGSAIKRDDGSIDRRRLGAIVFADDAAREDLERIVHPWMIAEVERIVTGGTPAARSSEGAAPDGAHHRGTGGATACYAINAALLFEMRLHRLCSLVLWVQAPVLSRVIRARRRDRLSLTQIVRRLWAQRQLSPQSFLGVVDIIRVKNSGRRELLESQIVEIVTRRAQGGGAPSRSEREPGVG